MLLSDLRPPVPCQSYQSGQSQHVYQYAEEKRVYQIDDNPAFEIDEKDLNAENSYFTNKGYKELQINFVETKSICDCCLTSFQSCFALYRHIKSGCNALKRITVAETGLDLSSPRPVLYFTAKLSVLGSDLAFKGWSYTTTLITFDLAILPTISNPDTLVYLNTDCGVNLVDITWLAKKHLF